ncbi:MAG: DNA polymerase III subunit delta [Tissierellia bacterium]|nr:DNA polymerase III subunit delta [Tissierellia bacterium]
MDYQQALKELKNNRFPPSVTIEGEESYLISDLIQKVSDNFIEPGMEDIDLSRFDGKDLREMDFQSAIQSPSLFSQRRIIIVEDAQKFSISSQSEKMLKELFEGILVIFLPSAKDGSYRKLSSLTTKIDCQKIKRPQMEAWIRKEMRLKGKVMESDAMALLIDQSRYLEYRSSVTLFYVKSELDKMASLEEKEITLKRVESLMHVAPEENLYLMMEQLAKRNKRQVFRLYSDYLTSGNSLYALVPAMVRNYYQLLEVKVLQEAGVPMQSWDKPLGISSNFIKRKLISSASGLTRSELLKSLDRTLEWEALYKSQSVDMHSLIQNLLLELLSL